MSDPPQSPNVPLEAPPPSYEEATDSFRVTVPMEVNSAHSSTHLIDSSTEDNDCKMIMAAVAFSIFLLKIGWLLFIR